MTHKGCRKYNNITVLVKKVIKMNKKIKTIIAVTLCIIGVLWLIPTIFVETTVLEITDYQLVQQESTSDTYEISFSYQRGDQVATGTYTRDYPKDWSPSLKGQEVCHYYTVPPFSVHTGDAPSPMPPLCCMVIGVLLPFLAIPKWLKNLFIKKENRNEL